MSRKEHDLLRRKKIRPGEAVEVGFSVRERALVLDHTLAGPDVTERLKIAEVRGSKLVAQFTLDDLDELIGYIAAEANHTSDRRLQSALDRLYDRLKATMESYDDGQWQQAF